MPPTSLRLQVPLLGLRDSDFGIRVSGLEFRVPHPSTPSYLQDTDQGLVLGFRISCCCFRVQSFGIRISVYVLKSLPSAVPSSSSSSSLLLSSLELSDTQVYAP